MRRGLVRVIPIFAIALLAQLLSPIGALRFVVSAISDPQSPANLCAAMAAADSGDISPGSLPREGGCCVICAVGLGGGAVPAPVLPAFSAIERIPLRLVWSHAEQTPLHARAGVNAQARAPPPSFAV
jgi:hypothetical protein